MARLARVVVPGLPYHVTQPGNGRRRVFFADPDYAAYRDWLAEAAHEARVTVWAWCLMSNHVHLILVPQDEDGLRRALARVHRRYAGLIHARRRRTGHFWQGRYGAVAMDEEHLAAAYRYVNLNPVRARLVERAEGLAVVERARPSGPRRGRPYRPRARPPALFPLRRPPGGRRGRRGDGAPHARARASAGRPVRTRSSPRWKPGPATASTPSSAGPSQRTTERPRPRSNMHVAVITNSSLVVT